MTCLTSHTKGFLQITTWDVAPEAAVAPCDVIAVINTYFPHSLQTEKVTTVEIVLTFTISDALP